MKLSEAIRLGAHKRPQTAGAFFVQTRHAGRCSSSLGAAFEAVTGKTVIGDDRGVAHQLDRSFPCLSHAVTHPVTWQSLPLVQVIPALDDEGWSRERIAEWLAKLGY